MDRVLGVIPARLDSQRVPRKVLRTICGRPMLAWVYERARRAKCLDRLLVATDAEEVFAFCEKSGIPSVMTSKELRSGTDRIVEVLRREPAEICVNIQGDEPTVTAEQLRFLENGVPIAVVETELDTIGVDTEEDLKKVEDYFRRTGVAPAGSSHCSPT